MAAGSRHRASGAVSVAGVSRPPRSYARGTDEFSRFVNFSDAVFAIAMTIIVVGIAVPADASDPAAVLRHAGPEIMSFFISFAVLGFYWLAHHRFMARLGRVEAGLLTLNLVYLAFIAFIPYPTALVGNASDEASYVALYAAALAGASLSTTLMLARSHLKGCFTVPLSRAGLRFGMIASTIPVAVFVVSIPIAYFVSPSLALVSWAAITYPAEAFLERYRPADVDI